MPLDNNALLAQLLMGQQGSVPTPLQRPTLPTDANPESRLTPGQMNGLQYSRDRYQDGTYQFNPGPDPSVTSFMGAIGQAPDSSYMNFPTFWDGKVMKDGQGNIDFRAAMARALQYEAQTGKQFARYPTQQTAEWGEMQAVHPIMDADGAKVIAGRPRSK